MTVDPSHIYFLSYSQRNTRDHIAKLKQTAAPSVLTVNGQTELIAFHRAFEEEPRPPYGCGNVDQASWHIQVEWNKSDGGASNEVDEIGDPGIIRLGPCWGTRHERAGLPTVDQLGRNGRHAVLRPSWVPEVLPGRRLPD